ncbi:MAG TPA: glucuronate isomerase [Bryobacteraceae bacterium]|nr:glucuronate isomerase [Bryobacteraceae bacterium]
MSIFPSEDFLLETQTARRLYHEVAKDLPIIDYHCHLSPELIADNHRFRSITEIWLEGDHYKWRAMRANGVNERYCTGDASDWEKFEAWARTVPETLCNPLFHWTAMELRRPFGITKPLNGSTAREIFEECNRQLQTGDLTTQSILRQFHVTVACTTDDPADTLEAHQKLAQRPNPDTRVYPTWRPDKALAVSDPVAWNQWIGRLEKAADISISSWSSLLSALETRHTAFHELGCRASDHGLNTMDAAPFTDNEASACFEKLRKGQTVSAGEAAVFRSALLYKMALLDHARGWAQQFHLGALRGTNTRMRRVLGPDTGFDSIGDFEQAGSLAQFLDRLDNTDQLAKTIIYNVNPSDNPVFATMIGNYQDGSVPGKMQWGSSWWFLDQLDGMEAQMRMLSNMGLLSRFVGMVTDSRSFLSYPRHDYFRRLVCRMLGEDVRRGLLPEDHELLGKLVGDVSFRNARDYFRFKLGSFTA